MKKHRVCPWWLGYLLLIPFRKIRHNPNTILSPYLKPGMKVIDYGSAMGYFSLPMAKMVGNQGKVYCFDIQQKMLQKLVSRAKKAGYESIVEPRLVTEPNAFNGLDQSIDFALLFFVAHEVSDQKDLFERLNLMLKPGALLLFAEPEGHVKQEDFEQSVSLAEKAGFQKLKQLDLGRNFTILLEKK